MDLLNVLPPSIEPTASGHILEQIELIQAILKNGYAYEVNGSIYFDLEKYTQTANNTYGTLSGKILDDLQTNSRTLDGQQEKRSAHDFALWKKATDKHIMQWPSPWGNGFPGWHLECTAMSTKYLGNPMDIHGGGMDLQFPHHEAEIAQCNAAHNHSPANYWMHNNMVTIDGQKMAKSKGNFITLEELNNGSHQLLKQAFQPMTIRFFLLQAHYRSTIDFSNDALVAAEKGWIKLQEINNLFTDITTWKPTLTGTDTDTESIRIEELCAASFDAINQDFNTAKVLANLFEIGSKMHAIKNGQLASSTLSEKAFQQAQQTYQLFFDTILGLKATGSTNPSNTDSSNKLDTAIQLLIDIRKEAKQNKDYSTSDKIRNELNEAGIILKDGKDGKVEYSLQ